MSKKPKVITMIPVRMASSRLPNKPLLDINGKTLIQRVYEHVKNNVPGDVVIAAGDQVIVDVFLTRIACRKLTRMGPNMILLSTFKATALMLILRSTSD